MRRKQSKDSMGWSVTTRNRTNATRRRLLAAAGAAVMFAVLPVRDAFAEDETFVEGARSFIEDLAASAVKVLTDESLEAEVREARFREIFDRHFDVPTIGRWVLGRHWRHVTARQKREYLDLFEELIVVTYLDRFSRYSGERLEVVSALKAGGRDCVIQSIMQRPDGHLAIRVGWRVRADGGAYRIVDVIVESVSLGQTQRSEFAALLRRNGGRINGFLEALRRRVGGIRKRHA